jgi:putative hydrolase of the HAD superfamily
VLLIFDLDDTLVDTFGTVIRRLEKRASESIALLLDRPEDAESIFRALMSLRLHDPDAIGSYLQATAGSRADAAIEARRGIFADFEVADLVLRPPVKAMLLTLAGTHKLVLLSEGREALQRKKLRRLGIEDLFDAVMIVSGDSEDTKERAILRALTLFELPASDCVVIGNRIDREIRAGEALGCRTIWVRHGEGSQYADPAAHARPGATVDDVLEVPAILRRIADDRRVIGDEAGR